MHSPLLLTVCFLTATQAENLLHNASFEVQTPDVSMGGYNRYCSFRDPVALRLATTPVAVKSKDAIELEELEGPAVPDDGQERGWRWVQEPGKEKEGKVSLRTETREAITWGTELKEGWYTFSVYARSREKEMLRLNAQDIRGLKGEIRFNQDKGFELGPEWTRCDFPVRVVSGPVTWTIETLGDGTVWIDAVQLEAGQKATPFELHPWDQTPAKEISEQLVMEGPSLIEGLAHVDEGVLNKKGESGKIALHAGLPAESPSTALPISGGIPIPRGHLFNAENVTLKNSNGEVVPTQTRVLSRHVFDGSIQMLLVDAGAQVPDYRFHLEYGPEIKSPGKSTDLRVEESANEVTVDTGPLRFSVRKQKYNLIDSLFFDSDGNGKFSAAEQQIESSDEQGAFTADPMGRLYWSSLGDIDWVRVEESGPVRCCIAASGTHRGINGRDLFRYVIRIQAFAGKPWLRIDHTFINEQAPFSTIMTGAGIRLGLKHGMFEQLQFDSETPITVSSGEEVISIQNEKGVKISGDTRKLFSSRSEGWTTLRSNSSALTAVIREWEWMPHKEFCFAPDKGLDLCIWPRHHTDGLAVPVGVSRSHRMWLHFHQPDQSDDDRRKHLNLFQGESLVQAEPSWYCESNVFGPLAHKDTERFPQFENMLDRKGEGIFGRFPGPADYRWHDFIIYGDDRGDMGWGNMETMVDHSIFLLYIRSLDPWHYRRAFDAAVHYRDVDICHPWGQCRVHSHNNTLLPWDGSHSWIKGVLDHYLLTGDPRSLRVANEHARWIRTKPIDYEVKRGTRRFTRLVENLADIYRFTGHKAYLENFTERLNEAEKIRGDNLQMSRFQLGSLYRSENPTPSFGRMGFPQYYAVEGLMQMSRATEDARWKEMFKDEMEFTLAEEPGIEQAPKSLEAIRQWGARQGVPMIETETRSRVYLPCMNYLYELTGDRRWIEAPLYSAIYATTDDRWKDMYPNISFAGLSWFAHALYYPMKQGFTAEDETRIRKETRLVVMPTDLRDGGFEDNEGSGYSAWGSSHERTNASRIYDIAKDPILKVEGKTSFRISEKANLDKLERKKAFNSPYRLTRQRIFLPESGIYQLTGYVRYKDRGRPNVSLVINGDSGTRKEFDMNLPSLLPERTYDDIQKAPEQAKVPAEAKEEGEKDIDAEFGEAAKEINPEDFWWKFSISFPIPETCTMRVQLHYLFGLRPPGTIWFDDFKLSKLGQRPEIFEKPTLIMQK
ncbi:MAG: hypothetical protein O2857_01540 [Planctomycetota bacterium]|nr:hypothetical protein [Planctomycetota bacterium]